MSILDVGVIYILNSVVLLLVVLSKYFGDSIFTKVLNQRKLVANVVFAFCMTFNFIVALLYIDRIDRIYLLTSTTTIESLILILSIVLTVAILSLVTLLEMDNLIFENKKENFVTAFFWLRITLVVLSLTSSIILLYLIMFI